MLSTAEAAALLGVSPQRVRQMVDEGKLQAERVGKVLTFKQTDVERAALSKAPAQEGTSGSA